MKWWLLPIDIHDWKPPISMLLGTVTQKFGKISWLGATENAPVGVENWIPTLEAGTARSVAPVGPTEMPGAVGMPSLEVAGAGPASSAEPPEEPPELDVDDDVAAPPELLPLLPLLAVALPPELPVALFMVLPPPFPFDVSVPGSGVELGKPVVLGAGELQARKPVASKRAAPDKTRFTFSFDVWIMTRLRPLLGFVKGAIDDSPTRQLLPSTAKQATSYTNQSTRNYPFF
jgi:hypothetical protein